MMELNTSITRTCTGCFITKALDDFHRVKAKKSGHVSQCKLCVAKKGREWREKNRDKHLAKVKEWITANSERHRENQRKSQVKRTDKLRDYQQKRRDELCEAYVRRLITASTGVAQGEIPSALVETYALQIAISRIIKEKK